MKWLALGLAALGALALAVGAGPAAPPPTAGGGASGDGVTPLNSMFTVRRNAIADPMCARLRWVSVAPFGRPVVPDVKRIMNGSSSSMATSSPKPSRFLRIQRGISAPHAAEKRASCAKRPIGMMPGTMGTLPPAARRSSRQRRKTVLSRKSWETTKSAPARILAI